MSIGKADVLEVLADTRLRQIHFACGPITVNAAEYDKVADYIGAGAIRIEPGRGAVAMYLPQINTLRTRSGEPPLDLNARTNLVHECTHAISDINKVRVTRLADEAAAYLAQVAYLLLLDPSVDEPPLGTPLNNMMRQCMQLVRKYQLGKAAGLGATIAEGDVSSLAQVVGRIPDYGHLHDKDMLAADGVALGSRENDFYRLRAARVLNEQFSAEMRRHVAEMLTVTIRYAAHENYVTWDPELLSLVERFAHGSAALKEASQKKLLYIFLTVDQRSATELSRRLSVLRKGDPLSERFQRGLPPSVKSGLLAALRLER